MNGPKCQRMNCEVGGDLSCTELLADVEFLAQRSSKAGSCSFSDERDTGMSSNSIVAIAYGITLLENQTLPIDWDDLNACEKMWRKLPAHRKTPDAISALDRARVEVNRKYPTHPVQDPHSGQWHEQSVKAASKLAPSRGSAVGGDFYNGVEWLACWLIDNAEGETITEEQLRPWAVKAWEAHLKRQNDQSHPTAAGGTGGNKV